MSRYIDVDKKLTITVYDDEHEENIDRYMTIEEILDTYTSEGCPTTADVVSKEKYDELNEKYHRLLENANILADAVREYERREDAEIH